MHKIRPAILIGIGPQSQRTVRQYVRTMRTRQGYVPAILPIIINFTPRTLAWRRESQGIQYLSISSPVFQEESAWPAWLPFRPGDLSSTRQERTRAWMRAALLQRDDDLQEFLLESIPRLSSFAAVEEMRALELLPVGDNEIGIYVIADLSDQLGSSIFVDTAVLISQVCRQLGLSPLTTGVLYLPSATSPAPVEEAIAYAALRELDHYFHNRTYDGEIDSNWSPAETFVPFDNGCYLLDSVNELGYTLQDAAQQVAAVSEWLYAMTFLDMATAIRERRKRRYLTSTLRRKARAYESFGIAVRYVPQVPLLNWCVSQMGIHVLEHLLDGEADIEPEKRAQAFVERIGLRSDALESRLRWRGNGERVDEMLAPLHDTGLEQIELRARQVLQSVREQFLPALRGTLDETQEQIQQELREDIHKEVRHTLEDAPGGGVRLARQFLDLLFEKLTTLQQDAQERTKRQRVELRRSLAMVSQTHYTLRSVVMSVPPWPLSMLGGIAVLVLPLWYGVRFISEVLFDLDRGWGIASLSFLGLGVLGVLGFIAARLLRQRRLVQDQHARLIRERLALESKPLVLRAMKAVYDAAQEAISQAKVELSTLEEELGAAATHLEVMREQNARELRTLALPGPFRSVVDLDSAEALFARIATDPMQLINTLTRQFGPISEWLAAARHADQSFPSWLKEQLSADQVPALKGRLDQGRCLDLLSPGTSEIEIRDAVGRMSEEAHPLWSYDPRLLRRAKTQRLTLLGIDAAGSAWASMVGPVLQAYPDVIPVDTGDSLSMAFVNVHRGVPLFALRRIGEYRAHYAEMLWHSKLPLHGSRALALVDDLLPTRRRSKLATATLFAAGVALETIRRDTDRRYLAPRAGGRTIRLCAGKESAVALLSLDRAACREVQRQLEAQIAERGESVVRSSLDEYVTVVPDLEDWEVRGILDFCRAYALGSECAAAHEDESA